MSSTPASTSRRLLTNSVPALAISVGLALLLPSCGLRDTSPSLLLDRPTATLSPVLPDDGRQLTAKQSYPVAQEEAARWYDDATLYAIVPSYDMAENLHVDFGDEPGWVFKFGRPEGRLELFVHVAAGHLLSATQAHPVYFDTPPEYFPIHIEDIAIDSPQVLAAFVDNGGLQYLAEHPNARLDYELSHSAGATNPVWTLWDHTAGVALLRVDAVTGEEV